MFAPPTRFPSIIPTVNSFELADLTLPPNKISSEPTYSCPSKSPISALMVLRLRISPHLV